MNRVTLGNVIRVRRAELGLTQEQLAELAGSNLRQSDIARLEADRVHLPRRDRLEQLAAALGLPLGELLVRSGWMEADTAIADLGNGGSDVGASDLDDRLEELEDKITKITGQLVETRHLLVGLRRELNVTRGLGGEIRPPIGVIKSWESSATFAL